MGGTLDGMNEWFANLQPPAWLAAGLTQVEPYALPAGGVIALALAVLLVRSMRRTNPDTLAVRVAVLLASAFSAQGMYEVATQRLHMPWWIAGGLFVVAEAGMLASGVRAHRMWEKCGRLGPHGRFVWIIATVAGFTVSLNARSASEYVLRLAMPLLAAGLWWMGYVTEDVRARAVDAITYRWSLRRLGVVLGVIEPGDRDLATVNADRLIRRMTTHAHGVHHGWLLRGWHRMRLRRLTLLANDDAAVTEVQRRVERVHYIESSTAPMERDIRSIALPGRWWRPWSRARQIGVAMEQLRVEQAAERMERIDMERRSTEALQAARLESERSIAAAIVAERAEAERRLHELVERTERAGAEHVAAMERLHVEHSTAVERLRVEHAEQLDVERSRSPRFGAPRATRPERSGAGQSDGAERRYNAVLMTDTEAIKAMLALHDAPNYQWSQGEVQSVARCGVTRSKRLIDLVAEHHRSAAEQAGDDDSERQPEALAV
jgi:hypothetical protein